MRTTAETDTDDATPSRRRRPRVVTIVDIGLHPSFDSSTAVIQASLRSLDLGGEEETVAVDLVRTRDRDTILSAMTAKCDVLHVVAHGGHLSDNGPTLYSDDESVAITLAELRRRVERTGRPVTAPAVLLDGCDTMVKVWQREFAACLADEIAYIGTRGRVGWHEALVFGPAFYASLFRSAGRGRSKAEYALDAAQRAEEAYGILTDRKSPYRSTLLPSSRS